MNNRANQFLLPSGSLIACLEIETGFDPSELLMALALFVSVLAVRLKIPAWQMKLEPSCV
jgi:hypothetical protein